MEKLIFNRKNTKDYALGTSFVWQRLPHKILYALIRVGMCCATAWLPLISGAMVNLISMPGFSLVQLFFYASLGIFVEILSYGVGTWVGYFWSKNTQWATVDIKKTLWRKIQHLSAQRWDSMAPGMWMSRIERDASVVLSTLKSLLDFSISTTISFIFASVVILYKVPLLWCALMGFSVLQLLTYKAWSGRFKHMAQRQRELDYQTGEVTYDLIGMTALFKCFGVEKFFFPLYDGLLHRVTRRALGSERLHIRYNTVMQIETWTMRIVVLLFCFWLYSKGSITLGDIVIYSMYVGQLIGISLSITGILPSIEQGRESAKALSELITWCDTDEERKTHREVSRSIHADHLTFQYENADKPVIHDFSTTIGPRSFVCFVGRNGSGKSTLIKLLLGVYPPTSGTITALNSCAFVPQHNAIYNDTFLENVRLRDKSISTERVVETLHQCGLSHFLERHPIHSKLHPNTLSGGELQMLGIARAMVRQPDVLLLDELTNNLDVVARERIAAILERLRHLCTIIVVTHDLHATRMADRVFLFNQGLIEEVKGVGAEREEQILALLRNE